MNENIQRMIDECTSHTYSDFGDHRGSVHSTYFDAEKFAELIVRECIGICKRVGTYDHTSPADCIGVMKKEFGVEE